MSKIIDLYLDRVLSFAELPETRAGEIREELADHLHSDFEKFRAQGASEEDAAFAAVKRMGPPALVGKRIARPFAWVDIRSQGTARGVIAIGPRAVGVFAFGGIACGVVAIGGVSVGVISFGGLGLGLLVWAGMALGLITSGGMSVGAVAGGGLAIGLVAAGGTVYGLSVPAKFAGAAMYAKDQVPGWLKSLDPLLEIPKFFLHHMGWILPVYLVVIAVCVTAQIVHAVRTHRTNERNWIFD